MSHCFAGRESAECFLFILGEHDMSRQTEHFKQLRRFVIHVGENNKGAALFRDVNDAQQDGDANAVDELGVAEVDHERACTRFKLLFALPLDPFAGQLVKVVASVNDGSGADDVRANVGLEFGQDLVPFKEHRL